VVYFVPLRLGLNEALRKLMSRELWLLQIVSAMCLL